MKTLRLNRDGFGLSLVAFSLAILFVMVVTSIAVSKQEPRSGISTQASQNFRAESSQAKPLVVIEYRGGLCKQAKECTSVQTIYGDGTFDGHSKLGTAEITKLRLLIDKSDFQQYPKIANADCPSYLDGQDEILSFPQKYPEESFKLCELDIPADEPTVRYIHSLQRLHD